MSLLRRFWRRPSEKLSVVALLGLAIGLATAMFTIIDALFLTPVPFADPDNLALLQVRGQRGGASVVPRGVFHAWKGLDTLKAVEAAVSEPALVAVTEDVVVNQRLARVTPGLFDLVGGVAPVMGRLFDRSSGGVGQEAEVLLSERLWRSRFNADPAIVGRRIVINDGPGVVIGILPSKFRFPEWNTTIWRADTFPATAGPADQSVSVYVRFRSDIPRTDALNSATAAALAAGVSTANWATARPVAGAGDSYRRSAWVLVGGVALLFVVLCANAGSLLLVGLIGRRREFELCAALGASRARLIGSVCLEIVAAGAAAALLGLGLASLLVSIARATLPVSIASQTLSPMAVDLRALAMAAVAGLAAVLCAGILPAILSTRITSGRGTQLTDRSGSEVASARIAKRTLLIVQVAVSCAFLLVTTLLVRSFVELATQDRGLDTQGILIARVRVPGTMATQEARTAASRLIEDQARSLANIRGVSWSYGTPPGGGSTPKGDWTIDAAGAQPVRMTVNKFFVDPGFFDLYSIPILKGRALTAGDDASAALVSERFARSLWPDADVVGRRFSFDGRPPFEVIGVTREIHYPSLDQNRELPQFYVRFPGVIAVAMLSMRCGPKCPDPALVHNKLRQANSGAAIDEVRVLQDSYATELVEPRAAAVLALAFAATALVAAATGLFGLLSHHIARRRRECGIRAALGAPMSSLRWLVWREAAIVVLPGLLLGAGAGAAAGRAVSPLLFHVTSADPSAWLVVSACAIGATALACWGPAHQSTRVDPNILLRNEP